MNNILLYLFTFHMFYVYTPCLFLWFWCMSVAVLQHHWQAWHLYQCFCMDRRISWDDAVFTENFKKGKRFFLSWCGQSLNNEWLFPQVEMCFLLQLLLYIAKDSSRNIRKGGMQNTATAWNWIWVATRWTILLCNPCIFIASPLMRMSRGRHCSFAPDAKTE